MAILVIIGPSGAGKSSIVRRLIEDNRATIIPTWTTRPPRDDESNDIEHRYVNDEVFDKRLNQSGFLAAEQMFGLPYRYGLPTFEESDSLPTLLMLRAEHVSRLKHIYPNAVTYQIQAPQAAIIKRLQQRGEPIGSRVSQYSEEVTTGQIVADRVFENTTTLDALYSSVIDAIKEDFA